MGIYAGGSGQTETRQTAGQVRADRRLPRDLPRWEEVAWSATTTCARPGSPTPLHATRPRRCRGRSWPSWWRRRCIGTPSASARSTPTTSPAWSVAWLLRWPGREYRAAFAAVLGADEHALGFRPPRRSEEATPLPIALAAAVLAGDDPDADGDAFDRLAAVIAAPRRVDTGVVEHLAAVLAAQRQLEDIVGAARVLPSVLAEVELIETLAPDARGPVRAVLVGLASQYRQFAGWLGEDTGDHAAALAHYDRAADAATETGDSNMVTSVLSMKSHLAWSRRDAARAVGLAVAGQRDVDRVSPGVQALVVQQQARGHALDGDADEVGRLLDRTEALTAQAAEQPDAEPPWVYFNGPERVLFQRGVAYLELGRYGDAVELFAAARARLPVDYRRDHARYAANLALAAALDGQVDRAAAAGREALTLAVQTGGAHTVADLRRARRVLDRWADTPAVAEFDAALVEAGRRTAGAPAPTWSSSASGTRRAPPSS